MLSSGTNSVASPKWCPFRSSSLLRSNRVSCWKDHPDWQGPVAYFATWVASTALRLLIPLMHMLFDQNNINTEKQTMVTTTTTTTTKKKMRKKKKKRTKTKTRKTSKTKKQKIRKANTQTTHIQVQNWKKKSYLVRDMSLKYTPVTKKHTLSDLLDICKNHTAFKLRRTRIYKTICSLWFWHTCYLETRSKSSNLVLIARARSKAILMQSLKKPRLRNFAWTASVKRQKIKFLSNQETRQLSLLNVCKSKKK